MLTRALQWLLQWRWLRERLAFALARQHYPSLNIRVPLSGGLTAPVTSEEAWLSFSEIFLQGEYDSVWAHLPLPDRWLDLGCHAGYFSLHCESRRRSEKRMTAAEALLVDADPRSVLAVERMIFENKLAGKLKFQHGAVGSGDASVPFFQRPFMSSGVAGLDGTPGHALSVPVVAPEQILALLPPPYDLIKVDIEGSEYDFVEFYEAVWNKARHVLIECHETAGSGRTLADGMDWIIRRTGFERLSLGEVAGDPTRRAALLLLRRPEGWMPAKALAQTSA
ncbi:MAG TPA: FkbM family methyltransferase [Verrucomicrobiaceae bacterium]